MNSADVSVVIPALNEEEPIADVVRGLSCDRSA